MLAALLLSILPYSPVVTDRVAAIETNHIHGECGNETLTQLIFWNDDGRVIAWRMKKREPLTQRKGVIVFWDGETMRRIEASSVIESWTVNYDPEIEDRWIVPTHARKELGARP